MRNWQDSPLTILPALVLVGLVLSCPQGHCLRYGRPGLIGLCVIFLVYGCAHAACRRVLSPLRVILPFDGLGSFFCAYPDRVVEEASSQAASASPSFDLADLLCVLLVSGTASVYGSCYVEKREITHGPMMEEGSGRLSRLDSTSMIRPCDALFG